MYYYITHPDVVIDPDVPVPQWPLSETGLRRMEKAVRLPFVSTLEALYCSMEQKARDGASVLGTQLDLKPVARADLGENDRSSTGFLPKEAFLTHVEAFFGKPDESVAGWETARNAQTRVVNAVRAIVDQEGFEKNVAIVGHGGVGSLLLTALMDAPISMNQEQPGTAGGNWFSFDPDRWAVHSTWGAIDV